jgi:proline racemase
MLDDRFVGPVEVADYHTAGEPFRIVTAGAPVLEGATVLDRRSYAAEHVDHLRQLLVNEPRGHADMYGCFVTPADDSAGDIGVVFFHKDGYSTACGHGTIALVTWAIESGLIDRSANDHRVVVDAPSGRLVATAEMDRGRVGAVSFINVPSFVSGRRIPVQLSAGVIGVDVSYGGAYYASVDTADLGLEVRPENVSRFIELGREVKEILETNAAVGHPLDVRLSGLYGTIFFEDVGNTDPGMHQRNVTVFADGEVDRSPCGSGTSARLALLDSAAELRRGEILVHESIVGTTFTGRVVGDDEVAGIHAVSTEVRGSAFKTGEARFVLDEDDPIGLGFQLR